MKFRCSSLLSIIAIFIGTSCVPIETTNKPPLPDADTSPSTPGEPGQTRYTTQYVTRPRSCSEVATTYGHSGPLYSTCTQVDPPFINAFEANPSTTVFNPGQVINLKWETLNATQLTLSEYDVSGYTNYNLKLDGSAPKTLTLTARNRAGTTVTRSLTLYPASSPYPETQATVLTGDYVRSKYVNCTPAEDSDFMKGIAGARIEPLDCVKVLVANPVFSWTYPTNIAAGSAFTFILKNSSNSEIYRVNSSLPRLLLPYSISLTAGTYKWSVSYQSSSGATVSSQERRFTIPTNNQYKIPDAQEIKRRLLSKTKPRLFPQGTSPQSLRSLIQVSPYAGLFSNGYANETARFYQTAIPNEYPLVPRGSFSSEGEYTQRLTDIKKAAEAELSAIEALSFYGSVMQRSDYLDQARARILKLATYNVNGSTSEAYQDQANRAIFLALAIGIEFHHNSFSPSQRTEIFNALRERLNQTMEKFKNFDRMPRESHLLTATHYALQALLYVTGYDGFEPNPGTLLTKAWDAFITLSGTWRGGQDGGYGNGTAYGWFSLGVITKSAAALKVILDEDITKFPAIGNFGYNMIAQTPPGAKLWGQFGDELESDRHYMNFSHDAMRLMAYISGNNDFDWYWRMYDPNRSVTVHFIDLYHFLMLNVKPAPTNATTPNINPNFLFEDAGYAAIHSSATMSNRSSLFFRSSKLGAFNHSHADNNAFTFVSKGKEMFLSGGYYDWYMSPHHKLITRSTRFKNALTFDGGIGQAEKSSNPISPGEPADVEDASGKIVNFSEDGSWTHVTGDATLAYRGYINSLYTPFLTAAYRSISYNRSEGLVIIYDYASSATPRTFELNFQTWKALIPNGSNKFRVLNDRDPNSPVEVCMSYYGPANTWSFTSGFPVAPNKTFINQHQSRSKTNSKLVKFASITVIKEDCHSPDPAISWNLEKANVTVGSKKLIYDQKMIQY